MDETTRAALIEAMAAVNERLARVLADHLAVLTTYDAPFLRRHRIYRVDLFKPPQEVAFYVGFAAGGPAHLLTGRPDSFARLARADGVAIDNPAVAAGYAVAFLETTRSMSELFYVVRSVDDLRFRPNLDEERQCVRADAVARYRDAIAPPTAEERGGAYAVTAYAVRQQALERHALAVGRDGGIADHVTTLAAGLPLVFGH
jgi:hypothetical protein